MNTQAFSLLSDFSLLEVSGPDAERFLQGQLTCDVAKLPIGHWTLGACCTAKGRMVANFVIARTDSGFWLRLPRERVSTLMSHLAKYAVFFKAKMIDQSSQYAVLGKVPSALHPKLLSEPLPITQISADFQLTWLDGRIEHWLPITEVSLANEDDGSWTQADLALGLVWVSAQSHEAWVPQHIDWQKQGGVSFKKGCYTGQEIVARLEFLGKAKKQLMKLHSSTPCNAMPTENLQDAQGNNLGEVLAWQGTEGLGAVAEGHSLAFWQGQPLTLEPLFYAQSL